MRDDLFAAAALVVLLTIAGCAKVEGPSAPAPAAMQNESAEKQGQSLAYEHSIEIDTREAQVGAIFESAQAVCKEAVSDQCVLLESRLHAGQSVSATLKFRAKPSGIRKLLDALTAQGDVTSRSTMAEDLAKPIEDSSRKLEMLRDYQSRLEALRARASENIDSLIKLNRELAQVHSEVEALTAQKAQLVQRVETEVLNVRIGSIHNRSFWTPASHALSGFGSSLSDALSSAITGVAYLVPWSLVLLAFAWGGRKLWVFINRAKKQG